MEQEKNKTQTGLNQNVAGLLCYVFGWVTGIIFLLVEKENKFVRFHAMQSVVTFLGLTIIAIVAPVIPFFGVVISFLTWPVSIILWVVLMMKAYNGEKYKLPWAGDFAEKQV